MLAKQQPRGFDLLIGPNPKTFGTQRHNKCLLNKHKGALSFQKVRTKKPSAQKSTTSANRTPRGSDLLKGLNQKNLRHKRHNKYKTNAKGLQPSFKRHESKPSAKKNNNYQTNQKPLALNERKSAPSAKEPQFPEDANQRYPRKNRRMEARKGGDVLLSEPSASIIRPHRSKYKEENNPSKQQPRGEMFFPKHKICARCLVSEQTTSRRPIERREPFSPELPPTPVTLKQRAVRKGGDVFS